MSDTAKVKNCVNIGHITETDIDKIKALETDCDLSPWSAFDYQKEIRRPDSIGLIARYEDQAAGFIIMRGNEAHEAEIYNIGVGKQYRKKGIGQNLLNEAIRIAKADWKIISVWLEVRESNQNAADFYQKRGFEIIGQRRNFYTNPSENALLMRLDVKY